MMFSDMNFLFCKESEKSVCGRAQTWDLRPTSETAQTNYNLNDANNPQTYQSFLTWNLIKKPK